ncbi:MAG: Beta-monoglucosyldiacylglycerol synthase [Tenericutes bacterium ADurb.Bin239]|nr:MAG: Beta-monoglucosyldiacylglycerol synthase [Tenericutes bacterium ADurb.Bin239]
MGVKLVAQLRFFISLFEFLFGELPKIPGSTFGDILVLINTIFLSFLSVLYFYQVLLSIFSIVVPSKKYPETNVFPTYTFVTCARNEETVIAQLITTIRALDYPQDKINIHVVADNCTDNTAIIAAQLKARVFKRNDLTKIGKSHALEYYFNEQKKTTPSEDFAGYIVIDTDNVLDPQFLKEINKVYQAKNATVIASYRASTNAGDSFWAFGTGYSFLRECCLMHKGREVLGLSSYVSGTGFFVSYEKMKEIGGWKHHLLIEDIEFSAAHVIDKGTTHYAHDAIFYDEQAVSFKSSWHQRMRWVKGLFQVSRVYTWSLFKAIFARKRTLKERFSAYESFLFSTPFPAYIIHWFILYGLLSGVNLAITSDINYFIQTYLFTLFDFLFGFYIFTTIMSLLISFSNWKRIKMHWFKKIALPFVAFFFLLTYVPMLLIAPFIKVKWKPVKHYGLKKPL